MVEEFFKIFDWLGKYDNKTSNEGEAFKNDPNLYRFSLSTA